MTPGHGRPERILERLAVIAVCKRANFTLEEIAEMLDSMGEGLGRDKEPLRRKLVELHDRRAQLDQAIQGLEHAIACPEPVPLRCPAFRDKLAGVFADAGQVG